MRVKLGASDLCLNLPSYSHASLFCFQVCYAFGKQNGHHDGFTGKESLPKWEN